MQISEENKALIEQAIQDNEFYVGNEHLFEKFYREISRRTYLILSTKNQEEIPSYLREVANKVMTDVLERERASIEYRKMLQNASHDGIVSLKKIAEREMHQFDNVIDFRKKAEKNFSHVIDPIEAENKEKNNKTSIQKLLEGIYLIHQKNPLQYYFQIFYLKYYAQLKQEEISSKLNITQSELSLRFVKMLEELKEMGITF